MTDPFGSFAPGLESPYSHAVAVTPSNTVDLPAVSRALFVRGLGTLTCVMAGGETATFRGIGKAFGESELYHLRVSRILATGTDVDVVALW